VGADPSRVLERLVELRLLERVVPVTETGSRTRRRSYRIADNFLAFWLGVVDRHRTAIERGLGRTVLPVLIQELDDHLGPRWEQAFRDHLVRRADAGDLGPDIVALGSWWQDAPPVEIDAVALAGRERTAVLVGEAKWARSVDGERLRYDLERKAEALPRRRSDMRYAVAARERVLAGGEVLAVTAADVFGLD
jgi:AAA+ ATPase superfamily predicted ATPase